MAKRAIATARKQWPEVEWGVSVPLLQFEKYAQRLISSSDESSQSIPSDEYIEQMRPEIELMVGDLQRLKVYAERGYQVETEIPPEIWTAWRRLVDAGYDRYVLK